ncbi:trichohyalin [Melanotaenia boesemani]|uniref:trichohyalin n=1 Tax=Melanotaenia boesemani TaxID=1250792 RepID=UPI001C0469D7|nr:trichohyalin [Melanotaenia boesemani]
MDPNNPLSRIERTMWTVWGYISGAVTRFLRSQPAEVTNDELNSLNESTVDSKSSTSGQAQADTGVGEVREEQPVTDHLLRSPGVAWEICTTEIDLGSDEEGMQLRRGSSESENVEGMREEQSGQTGKDHAGLLLIDDTKTSQDAPEKTEKGQFYTCEQSETSENNEEHLNTGLGNITEDAVIAGVEISDGEGGVEERTHDDHQKLHETIAEIQVTEDEREKDEGDLKEEESEAKLCTFTDVRPEEKDSILRGEVGMEKLTEEKAKNYEGALELASENDNEPDERTKPVEYHLSFCDEMSDVSKDEFIVVGQDVRSDNNETEVKMVPVLTIKEEDIYDEKEDKEEEEEDIDKGEVEDKYISDDDEDKEEAEEAINDDEDGKRKEEEHIIDDEQVLLLIDDTKTSQDAPEKTEKGKFHTCEQSETPENNEEHLNTGLGNLTEYAIIAGVEISDAEGGVEERTHDDHQKLLETIAEIQVTEDKREKDEGDWKEEESEAKLCTFTDLRPEEKDSILRAEVGMEKLTQEKAKNYETEVKRVPVLTIKEEKEEEEEDIDKGEVEDKYISDNDEDEEEEEEEEDDDEEEEEETDEDIYEEEEEEASNKTTNNNTKEERLEQISRVFTEVWEEESNLSQSVTCSKVVIENTHHHNTEFTDMQEDVVTSVQTTTEKDLSTAEMSEGEKFVDNDQVEEERLSSEVDNKGVCMEKVSTITLVTVNPEGETKQEISNEFKNIPLQFTEGQIALSQERNTQVCEEAQEGIPEYNNELEPDENTTQWLLERGNYKEIQITQLPEEEESVDQESFKNKGTGAHCLLLGERLKEKQDSTEESECSSDLVVEEHSEKLQLLEEELCTAAEIQESGLSFGEREVNLSDSSMKTDIGSSGEADKITEELQDGTEVAEFRMDEDFNEASGDSHETDGATAADEGVRFAGKTLKFLEADILEMTEVRFCQESVYATHTEHNNSRTPSQPEEHSDKTEPKLLDDRTAEIQDVVTDTEDKDYADGEEKEDETQDKNETTHLQVAGMAAELITRQKDGEKTESELSQHYDSQELKSQSPYRAYELNETEITDAEAADKSKTNKPELLPVMSAEETTKHVTQSEEIYTEETTSLITEHQDVIDEDILDLWIETAMSEDTLEQHVSESEPQTDTMADPLNEEPDISEMEKPMELNSGESELASDTETSSSALQFGYLDQSFSETEQMKLISTSSLQGMQDMLATMSEFSASSPESLGVQMEETAETLASYLREEGTVSETRSDPNSGVSSPETQHPNQESAKSEEKPDEGTEAGMEVAVRACRDTEETDLGSKIKMSPLFQAKTKNIEDEPLETMSDLSDEIKLSESGQCKGDAEASLEECGSHDKPWTESEMKMLSQDEVDCRRSEDVTESSPEPSRAEVVEDQATKSEDQNEVDSPALDFTVRKSRIAVKNPRTRPPTNHRSLLHKPSLDPTPPSHLPVKVPTGVPLGGLGIGIKLPGLGAGLPVLKKTQRVVRDDNSHEAHPQEPHKKEEEKSDAPKQDETQHRPRWIPPGHPGFGNPLMSELKSKLKKTPKE